jgi:acyl-CoA thioesterase-1
MSPLRYLALALLFLVSPLRGDEGNSAFGKTPATGAEPALLPIEADPKLPQVLLIGDSISIGYTLPVRERLQGKANIHRPPINCGATTRGLQGIDGWLGATKWDVIHFNWGLHDLKYVNGKQNIPPDAYEENLREIVARLRKTGALLIWASTTPVPEGISSVKARVSSDVPVYNEIARRIMRENGVAIDDLYAFALPRIAEIQLRANVHYSESGSKVLAGQVAASIENALKTVPAKSP